MLWLGCSPVGVHSVQNGFKLRVWFSFLHHGQVVAQRTQAGFELLVIQTAGFLFVEVSGVRNKNGRQKVNSVNWSQTLNENEILADASRCLQL